LNQKLANQLGGCGKLLLCTKVASVIQFIDVINLKVVEITGSQYFQYEQELMIVPSKENLREFMVFDVEMPESKNQNSSFIGTKFKSSTAMVGRVSDWENFEVKTHMGDVLNEGSSVLAYDMTSINLTGDNDDLSHLGNIPEIIIVKKIYPEKKKNKKKVFKLKHLQKQEKNANNLHKGAGQREKDDKDYQEFLNELEEDAELRTHVNMYKDEKAIQELQNQPTDESKTEITTETDDSQPRKVHKKKAKKGKAGKKAAAAKTEEGAEDKEEEAKVDNDQVKPQKKDIKIEELLNDLILDDEQEVRVGAQLNDDDDDTQEEHAEDDGIEITPAEQK
jgi:nonsense-mediated mRNA decay protein 3